MLFHISSATCIITMINIFGFKTFVDSAVTAKKNYNNNELPCCEFLSLCEQILFHAIVFSILINNSIYYNILEYYCVNMSEN